MGLEGVLPVVVLLAAVAAGWMLLSRGRGGSGRGRSLRVLERLPLDARRTLCLVEADGRRLLVGLGDGAPRLVAELSESREGDATAAARGER